MPPTTLARLRALTDAGLLPETAQAIVANELTVTEETTAADLARAPAFVLYSAIVPDWLRKAWGATVYPPAA